MSFRIYIILIFLSYFSNLNAQENELIASNNNEFHELYARKKLKGYTIYTQYYDKGKIDRKLKRNFIEINKKGFITSQVYFGENESSIYNYFYDSNDYIISFNLIDFRNTKQKKDSLADNNYRWEYQYNENKKLINICVYDSVENLKKCKTIIYTNGKLNLVLSQNNDTIELYVQKNDTTYKYFDAASIAKYVDGKIISLVTYNEKYIVKYDRKGRRKYMEVSNLNGVTLVKYEYNYRHNLLHNTKCKDRNNKINYIENYEYFYY